MTNDVLNWHNRKPERRRLQRAVDCAKHMFSARIRVANDLCFGRIRVYKSSLSSSRGGHDDSLRACVPPSLPFARFGHLLFPSPAGFYDSLTAPRAPRLHPFREWPELKD